MKMSKDRKNKLKHVCYRECYVIGDLGNYVGIIPCKCYVPYALLELIPSLVDLSPSKMHFSSIYSDFSFIIKIQHALVLQLFKHFDFLFTEKI